MWAVGLWFLINWNLVWGCGRLVCINSFKEVINLRQSRLGSNVLKETCSWLVLPLWHCKEWACIFFFIFSCCIPVKHSRWWTFVEVLCIFHVFGYGNRCWHGRNYTGRSLLVGSNLFLKFGVFRLALFQLRQCDLIVICQLRQTCLSCLQLCGLPCQLSFTCTVCAGLIQLWFKLLALILCCWCLCS